MLHSIARLGIDHCLTSHLAGAVLVDGVVYIDIVL
jgi:hypothetical protein